MARDILTHYPETHLIGRDAQSNLRARWPAGSSSDQCQPTRNAQKMGSEPKPSPGAAVADQTQQSESRELDQMAKDGDLESAGLPAVDFEASVRRLAEVRISRTYKFARLLRHARLHPFLTAVSVGKWARAPGQGEGLLNTLGAEDPLGPVQQGLELAAPAGGYLAGASRFDASPAAGQVVIFAGVPYDDIGGGQRSAQLARCLLRRQHQVVYVYAFPKAGNTPSLVSVPNLRHVSLRNLKPADVFSGVGEDATVIFELPLKQFLPFAEFAWRRGLRTVFELIDDWDSSLGGDWYDKGTMETFARRCTVSVGTARLLCDRLRSMGVESPLYVPNAADDSVFNSDVAYARPKSLPHAEDGVLLYFGSLYGEWFSWEHVRAAALASPRKAFVLIGDATSAPTMPKNVHMIGPRKNEELPAYLAYSQAAIIPFAPGKITDAVSPIKVFEYLFLEKPVISTKMRELDGYPNVHQADSPAEFARLCADVPAVAQGWEFISDHSWQQRLAQLVPYAPAKRSFSFIILIHNNREIIGRCLRTLTQHTRGLKAEYIVVDNNSSDGGPELVERDFPGVRVVRNPKNGCSSGRNLGASVSTGDCLVFLDSDQWFTCGSWCHEADHLLTHHAGLGAIGWAAGWIDPKNPLLGGPTVDCQPQRGRLSPEYLARGFRTDVAYLGSGGLFVPRRVWNELDGFDTELDPTCFEDTDLSFQVKKAGYALAYRDLSGIRHHAHQTTGAPADGTAVDMTDEHRAYFELFKRNGEYIRRKWAEHPEYLAPLT